MKTKKIAKPEEWFKEFTPENVQVVMLCASTGDTTGGTNSGGDGTGDGTLKSTTVESLDSNSFSYNPFE